jgi:Leucine-rich repeat (LRR) protein
MTEADKETIEQAISQAIRDNADSLALDSRHRKEDQLPRTLLDIPNLRHFSMIYHNVKIPAWLADIPTLETLELEETGEVSEIVPVLWKLRRLKKLKLAHVNGVNGLTELPASLAKLEHLEELNVDGAEFVEFPPVIASLASLQSFSYLYCCHPLPEVFEALSALPVLKKLRLTHDWDEEGDFLPESFRRFKAIEELDFSFWAGLNELPEYIGEMRNLRAIDLSNVDHQLGYTANIKALPDSLGDLANLEELDIYGLQDLKELPQSFSRLSRLKRLDTMSSGIDELKLTPEQWKNLEELRTHGPLPDSRLCANLKRFDWFKNDVSVDPYGKISLPLSSLHKLESLWIHGGTLDNTDFLASMPNLRRLYLGCDFECFPKGFEKLEKLEEIVIWGAKSLTVLPEYLGNMPSLKELRLIRCGFEELPESVRRRREGLRLEVDYPFRAAWTPEKDASRGDDDG